VIRIENCTKCYGKRVAVDGISFTVGAGEIVGFLGPNGAGKTTTMRLITGYLMPTRGDVWVADHNMATHSLEGRRLIGYLPEMTPLYADMTVRSYLAFAARLRGVEAARADRRVGEVVDQCGLGQYADALLGRLSRGYRQRVGLAQAIIHDPAVLILDEPTAGIDPIQVAQTRRLIKELGRDRTILLSTHILPEVSMICERVIIIHEGRIAAQDRIENLSAVLKGGARLRLRVRGPADQVRELLGRVRSVSAVRYEEPFHVVEYPCGAEPQAEITETLVRAGVTLLAMESMDMSLEDIFLQLTTTEEADR
jgi:ABC-2 type transport system ATP-binding protein